MFVAFTIAIRSENLIKTLPVPLILLINGMGEFGV